MGKKNPDKPVIEVVQRPDAFFKEALGRALKNQQVSMSEGAVFYILSLLVRAVYEPTETERAIADRAVAISYREALQTDPGDSRAYALITIGNISLMICGIWWQSLTGKLVDVDYYVGIGSASYKAASACSLDKPEVFEELSGNFVGAANVLTEATESIGLPSDPDDINILRAYEVYLRTGNPFLARKLMELGIDVINRTTLLQ